MKIYTFSILVLFLVFSSFSLAQKPQQKSENTKLGNPSKA